MHGVDGGTIDRLVQECGINIDATEQVKLRKAKLEKKTRVFRLVHKDAPTFIIDTPMARGIACYSHLVGAALGRAARRAASQAFPAIMELAGVRKNDRASVVVFEHILRAALGYELQHVAPKFLGRAYRTTYIRPRYTHRSYRDHDGMVQREIEVVHEDFSQFPKRKRVTLIMQDTVASGRSGEVSIDAALKRCRQVGSEIEKWIVYGFIAEHGLSVLHRIAEQRNIQLIAFAMGNLTALSSNNYDMPLYGVDEAYWQKTHKSRYLGSTIDRDSLEEYIPYFVPGADQPGDWSARQRRLFNGTSYEPGEIEGHLRNSVRLITSLCEIGFPEPWQQDISRRELDLLQETLLNEQRGQAKKPAANPKLL